MSDQAAEIVETTADTIEEFGWIQKDAGSPEKGFCILGGMSQALMDLGLTNDDQDIAFQAQRAISADLPSHQPVDDAISRIIWWNDAEGRTQQEVLDHLRLVAKGLRD